MPCMGVVCECFRPYPCWNGSKVVSLSFSVVAAGGRFEICEYSTKCIYQSSSVNPFATAIQQLIIHTKNMCAGNSTVKAVSQQQQQRKKKHSHTDQICKANQNNVRTSKKNPKMERRWRMYLAKAYPKTHWNHIKRIFWNGLGIDNVIRSSPH